MIYFLKVAAMRIAEIRLKLQRYDLKIGKNVLVSYTFNDISYKTIPKTFSIKIDIK
jgi:hypothetical protein